jgi:hypothetical protein
LDVIHHIALPHPVYHRHYFELPMTPKMAHSLAYDYCLQVRNMLEACHVHVLMTGEVMNLLVRAVAAVSRLVVGGFYDELGNPLFGRATVAVEEAFHSVGAGPDDEAIAIWAANGVRERSGLAVFIKALITSEASATAVRQLKRKEPDVRIGFGGGGDTEGPAAGRRRI